MNITYATIADKSWMYGWDGAPPITVYLTFNPNGMVGGYGHPNESYWEIRDGQLCFLNQEKMETVRFTEVIGEPVTALVGKFLPDPKIKLRLEVNSNNRRRRGTKEDLEADIRTLGWEIGDHTYGVPGFIDKGYSRFFIGKYCSIAYGVKVILGNHRTDLASTYPFRAFRNSWPSVPLDATDHASKGDVRIGSDVWLGYESLITSGVTIGHGAVIGAKAVVTKDVPPYAIVAGNPARIIRYRFDEPTIEKLLASSWWDLPDHKVDELLPLMMSGDIDALAAACAVAWKELKGEDQ